MTSLALGLSRTVCEQDLLVHRQYGQQQWFTYMLKLCHFGTRNVHEWFVVFDDTLLDERLHAKMIVLYTQVFKVSPGEYQCAEVVVDGFEQRLRGSQPNTRSVDALVATVAVDAAVVLDATSSSAAKCFNGEDVSLFHALVSLALNERHLFVAVDLVA